MESISIYLQHNQIPYFMGSDYIKVTIGAVCAIIKYSNIGGIYVTLYTDTNLLEHIQSKGMSYYSVELLGITDVNRLVWNISNKASKPHNRPNLECLGFICSLAHTILR
jgi:hypothetical protein